MNYLHYHLNKLSENAKFAYLSIGLIQLKIMFWVWKYRDLPTGDTSSYYQGVFTWIEESKGSIVWSPIYRIFLVSLHRLFENPFWVLVSAQVTTALLASLLVLAVLRRLLPKTLAWFIAVWWVILPINFDTLYGVHLFSSLFPFVIFVIAAYQPNVYGRGVVLSLLIFTGILVRNEYIPLAILWGVIFIAFEIYQYLRLKKLSLKIYLIAYGVPLLITLFIISFFYAHTTNKWPDIKQELGPKHTLNVCQIYAYNRVQQGDLWQKNPWTECHEIMQRDFGKPLLTFAEAFTLNPYAILKHVWWNIKLIPSGTQLALFNYYAGGDNPDYAPAKTTVIVWPLFLLIFGVIVIGLIKMIHIQIWKKIWLYDTTFAWLLMASTTLLTVGIIMMQRPRPSYMFNYTLFIMALFGISLYLIFNRFLENTVLNQYGKLSMPIVTTLFVLLIPSHYDAQYQNAFGMPGQWLRNAYERVKPHIQMYGKDEPTTILTFNGDPALCIYVGKPGSSCKVVTYSNVVSNKPNQLDYNGYFDQLGINWLYLDGLTLQSLESLGLKEAFLKHHGGHVVACNLQGNDAWVVIYRPTKTE